jgi:hypothetical protein
MLPLAGLDPEGICLDEGKDGRSHQAPSPTVSHAGSSLEALVEDRWGQHYFAVSMSDAALNRSEGGGDRTGSFELSVDSTQDNISPCQSFTGPDSNMQMVPRRGARQGGEEEATSAELGTGMVRDCYGALHSQEALEKEKEELAKVKRFCQTILKTLAPPILQELENVSALRADAEPFTPKSSFGKHKGEESFCCAEHAPQSFGVMSGKPIGERRGYEEVQGVLQLTCEGCTCPSVGGDFWQGDAKKL